MYEPKHFYTKISNLNYLIKDLNNDIDEIGEMLTKLGNEVENDDKNCCSTSVDNIQINSGRASETQSLPNMNVFLASRVRSNFFHDYHHSIVVFL